MLEFRKKGYSYKFSDHLANSGFLLEFRDSRELQDNYKIVESTFPKETNFVLYEKDFIDSDFVRDYYSEDNFIDITDENSSIDFIDPLVNPSLVGVENSLGVIWERKMDADGLLSFKLEYSYQEILQKILVYVYKKYGKYGIDTLRSLGLANGLSKAIFSLREYEKIIPGNHPMIFNCEEIDPVTRVIESLHCDTLTKCDNENIKAALFYLSELLFKDGHIVDEKIIADQIDYINKELPDNTNKKLNQIDFDIICFLLCERKINENREVRVLGKYMISEE